MTYAILCSLSPSSSINANDLTNDLVRKYLKLSISYACIANFVVANIFGYFILKLRQVASHRKLYGLCFRHVGTPFFLL